MLQMVCNTEAVCKDGDDNNVWNYNLEILNPEKEPAQMIV
jgi:hypothetical protein